MSWVRVPVPLLLFSGRCRNGLRGGLKTRWAQALEGSNPSRPTILTLAHTEDAQGERSLSEHKIKTGLSITLEELEKEVKSLTRGERFTGEFQGIDYEAEVFWGEDWSATVDLHGFNPTLGKDVAFWLGKVPITIIRDVLYDALYELPEVIAFQARIDACREIDEDLLDSIFLNFET